MVKTVKCPYCRGDSVLVNDDEIYPHRPDLASKRFYLCRPCDAYVGTHNGSTKPLGRLANAELRRAKMAAHSAFDPLWKSGRTSRRSAYQWLAKQLGIEESKCHIGMFDVDMCRKVQSLCYSFDINN